MSHIPSSAMKHAGPTHHDEAQAAPPGAKAPRTKADDGGIGTGTWIAIGSTLLAGAAAVIAVPLLKARAVPSPTRRGKKATPKPKARKPQEK